MAFSICRKIGALAWCIESDMVLLAWACGADGIAAGADATHNRAMRTRFRRILRTFVAGSIAALPLVATLLILSFTIRFVMSWLGPESALGSVLGNLGLRVTGSQLAGYAIGVALMLAAIFLLGVLVEAGMQAGLDAVVDAFMQRIPIVRNIYETIDRFVQMLSRRETEGLRSMSPVWCHFGGPGGAAVLGLLSSPDAIAIGGKRYRAVLVPTAPVPIGGALIYVPDEWVTSAQVGMEALTSIYVSMGVTSSQYLGASEKR
jgi:uncharacterized membrane protein